MKAPRAARPSFATQSLRTQVLLLSFLDRLVPRAAGSPENFAGILMKGEFNAVFSHGLMTYRTCKRSVIRPPCCLSRVRALRSTLAAGCGLVWRHRRRQKSQSGTAFSIRRRWIGSPIRVSVGAAPQPQALKPPKPRKDAALDSNPTRPAHSSRSVAVQAPHAFQTRNSRALSQ